ncbi:glycosyltransferase family 2 protein [Vibrio sp. ZSDE26]|uniref:Glycosyltransferase family 2 protein n=1 Tax=Vibrio amylolyticus TaxID=2847292 RepID=A0A9X1XJZ6_9VIBR|nr:glycosyltransferase family 2 protein [Vibrio amylolyticus]MCK6263268.1 glycosyltransferase family 2 protein [Vibrio amylolyticus]
MTSVSLIITTYNWKEALGAVLRSIKEQTLLPNEVIIADDGSRRDTKELVMSYQQTFPVPIIHSWQPDEGFRAAESRNRAIAKASSDYIIIIDGDIYLPQHFVKDHLNASKKGQFIQGGRVILNEANSQRLISKDIMPSFFDSGIKNRKNMLRNRLLSKLTSRIWNVDKSTRSCNMSFWREDALSVNGFNNEFVGWGREDSEFVYRLLHLGLDRLYLKFSAAGIHLYHKENPRESLEKNDRIFKNTVLNKLTRCDKGIDRFLKEE